MLNQISDYKTNVDGAAAWAETYAVPVKVPDNLLVEHKWLHRSALQKAVRRGYKQEALQHLACLYAIDVDYAWYTMAIVASEDIGWGNPEVCLYSHLGQLKTFRKLLPNPSHLLTAIVAQACDGPKTRSCCELSIVVEWGLQEAWAEHCHMTTEDLTQAAISTNFVTSFMAVLAARGRAPKAMGAGFGKNLPALLAIEEHARGVLPARAAEAALQCMVRPVDGMSLGLLPMALWAVSEQASFEEHVTEFPEADLICGFRPEVYDMHCMEGKRALKALHTHLKKKYPILNEIAGGRETKAMGALVFVLEGGEVDRRLMNTTVLRALKNKQDRTLCTTYGVPEQHYAEMLEIVRENGEALRQKRYWSAKLSGL
jgi:hypothetical protein